MEQQFRISNILLADDDEDDSLLFKNALDELGINAKLEVVYNGKMLIDYLENCTIIPSVIFLDMNMPLKNGLECLHEIKSNDKLRTIPVLIITTSLDEILVKNFYDNGAYLYIKKPNNFQQLKELISRGLAIVTDNYKSRPLFQNFCLKASK